MAGCLTGDPCYLIRSSFVRLKGNLIPHTTLIDELLASFVLSDEEKDDYRNINHIKCGKLIKEILKKGRDACAKFLSILENQEYGCLQEMIHPTPLDEDESFPKEHLRNHRTLFLEELEPSITADYLLQFYVFSIDTHDEIEKESLRLNMAQLVLHHLSEKSPKCLDIFGQVLKLSQQDFIIRTLYEQEGRNSLTPKGCDLKIKILNSMDTRSSYRVHQCSKCPGDTGYFCVSCPFDLCPQCKEKHVQDLQTIDHDVVSHRDKINYIPTQLDVIKAYKTKRQQHRGTIHTIRSEALFYRPVLLRDIKFDIKTCHTEFSFYQSEMLTKAQTLKHLINYIQNDFMCNVFCDFDFKHRCLKQKKEMIIHIVCLQEYELRYVQPEFTFSALQFLSSIKTALPQIHLTLHTSQLSMTESLNKEDVMESLSAFQITERGNRRIGNHCLLKLTSGAELHQSLTLTGVDGCYHISCVTSDRVWVSDGEGNLILTDTTGVPLHRVKDSLSGSCGLHTVNSESELIYIDRNYNINKLSKDMKTPTIFMERTYSKWKPRCVYWSPSTGDLLVGMCTCDIWTGKVTRYNQSGQLTQTIQHDNTGRRLYDKPIYITENNNGDVVVSDYRAVVVTEHGGRHRFSYTGHPSGSGLQLNGICTDALSHILVCDALTKRVQMLNKDGQFLSHFQIKLSPRSLCYDAYTHRLFVGSSTDKNVLVFKYITRQNIMINTADDMKDTADYMESMSEIPITEPKKNHQMKDSLLKMMPKQILQQILITDARDCFHISLVTSDRVWVSDYDNNLLCSNTIGETLFKVIDMCKGLFVGSHTVNTSGDLIYIHRNFNIMKLSEDRMIYSTLVKRIYPKWRPRCLYCSPSTGDLLVGMYIDGTKIGMVTHYNQLGELTHKIQQDNTGQNLYSDPLYITENNNGDIVVSDSWSAVVVTDRGGRHRFSYTGHPSGSRLQPWGICTDALSHILVCDHMTNSVQLLDRDGQFLSHLLIYSKEIFSPVSLSYDAKTNYIWVGSCSNNKVFVYKYIYHLRRHSDCQPSCHVSHHKGNKARPTQKAGLLSATTDTLDTLK